jgi:hypothetical protein
MCAHFSTSIITQLLPIIELHAGECLSIEQVSASAKSKYADDSASHHITSNYSVILLHSSNPNFKSLLIINSIVG